MDLREWNQKEDSRGLWREKEMKEKAVPAQVISKACLITEWQSLNLLTK